MRMIGDRPMTGAERIVRWRERHAKKLARETERTRYKQQPLSMDDVDALLLTPDDLIFSDK
jgi:hypothetical protein